MEKSEILGWVEKKRMDSEKVIQEEFNNAAFGDYKYVTQEMYSVLMDRTEGEARM